jgi:hypothetical protein
MAGEGGKRPYTIREADVVTIAQPRLVGAGLHTG